MCVRVLCLVMGVWLGISLLLFAQQSVQANGEYSSTKIDSITPNRACAGDVLTVRGEGLSAITTVSFLRDGGGSSPTSTVAALFHHVDATTLQVIAPVEARSSSPRTIVMQSRDIVFVTIPAQHTEIRFSGVERRGETYFATVRRGGQGKGRGRTLVEKGGAVVVTEGGTLFARNGSLIDLRQSSGGCHVFHEPDAKIFPAEHKPERGKQADLHTGVKRIIPIIVEKPFEYVSDRRCGWKKQLATHGIQSLAFSPNGRVIVAGTVHGDVLLASERTGAIVHRLRGHDDVVTGVAILDDGHTVVSAGVDGTLRWWNGKAGELVSRTQVSDKGISGMKLARGGERLLVSSLDGSLSVWDTNTRGKLKDLPHLEATVNFLDVTSDGKTAVTADEAGLVQVWDIEKGAQRAALERFSRPEYFAGLAPDEKGLQSFCDGVRGLWSFDGVHQNEKRGIASYEIRSAANSMDGHYTAVASGRENVVVWDNFLGREVRYYEGHGNETVTCVAYSSAGNAIASADEKGWVHLIDPPSSFSNMPPTTDEE